MDQMDYNNKWVSFYNFFGGKILGPNLYDLMYFINGV